MGFGSPSSPPEDLLASLMCRGLWIWFQVGTSSWNFKLELRRSKATDRLTSFLPCASPSPQEKDPGLSIKHPPSFRSRTSNVDKSRRSVVQWGYMSNLKPKSPDHRVSSISYIAMCGLRWVNGMNFGTRKSKCPDCEAKVQATIKRLAPHTARVAAARLARSKAFYDGGKK